MRLKSGIAALLATAAVASAAETLDLTGYTVFYDETTVLGQATAFQSNGITGFSWTVPAAVRVSAQASFAAATYALPGFAITVKPGYTVSSVSLFAGQFTYSEHDGRFASAGVSPELYFETWVNGVQDSVFSSSMDKIQTSGGALDALRGGVFSVSMPVWTGPFDTFTLDSAGLILRANANGAVAASVGSDGQTQLRMELVLAPVPEPQTAALFLAGLGALAAAARRRRR